MSKITESIVSQPQRYCKYIHRYCFQYCLDGYDYCIRHILADKAAPFLRCSYESNNKRCFNAAPVKDKNDKRETVLCPYHVKQSQEKTTVHHPKKKPAAKGAPDLLRQLEHYCDDSKHDPLNLHKHAPNRKEKAICVGGPYSDLKQVEESMETNGNIATGAHIENLDDDCNPEESTFHYLQHAGVFTAKEVCILARERMMSLQRLYCAELKILYRGIREARREFLSTFKKPSQTTSKEPTEQKSPKLIGRDLKGKRRLSSRIEDSSSESKFQKSSRVDATLRAYSSYPQRSGIEKIMRKRALDKQVGVIKFPKPTCTFEEKGFTCTQSAIVFSKFCKTHILSDPKQVLFVQCSENCKTPVIPIEEKTVCDYHIDCVLSKTKAVQEQPSVSDLPIENQPSCSKADIV